MLRDLASRLLLALALLVAQVGALTHPIQHVDGVALVKLDRVEQSGRDDDRHGFPGLCLQCVALAGLDLPLADGSFRQALADARFDPPQSATPAATHVAPFAPRCRAPPA